MTHIADFERNQLLLLPEAVDDYVDAFLARHGRDFGLADGEERWAAAAAGSSSLNSIGARSRFMRQMT